VLLALEVDYIAGAGGFRFVPVDEVIDLLLLQSRKDQVTAVVIPDLTENDRMEACVLERDGSVVSRTSNGGGM